MWCCDVTVVYVSSAESGELHVFRLDALEGTLTPLQVLKPGGKLMPMALSPDRRRLYLARRSEPLQALSFAIDPASGELTEIGAGPLPHSMAYIATDPSGRFLFSASYGGAQIAVSPIGADGVVGEAQQVLPTGPHAHAIQAGPGGRQVFATSLGGGVLMQYAFDTDSGRLAPHAVPLVTPHRQASPRHFVFSRDGRFAYLLNELDGSLDVLAFDAENGSLSPMYYLSTLPSGFTGEAWAADLHLTPDGRFLYTSERRSHTLAIFAVDTGTGRLTPLGHKATEAQPRGFDITPDGHFLIAAGEASHHLSVYRIDMHTGALHLSSRIPAGQGPNWVCSVDIG
jgi:6-phosphogluconolactonase